VEKTPDTKNRITQRAFKNCVMPKGRFERNWTEVVGRVNRPWKA